MPKTKKPLLRAFCRFFNQNDCPLVDSVPCIIGHVETLHAVETLQCNVSTRGRGIYSDFNDFTGFTKAALVAS